MLKSRLNKFLSDVVVQPSVGAVHPDCFLRRGNHADSVAVANHPLRLLRSLSHRVHLPLRILLVLVERHPQQHV
jgi:hypothetical protein